MIEISEDGKTVCISEEHFRNEVLVFEVEEYWDKLSFKGQLEFIVKHFSSETIVKTCINEVDLYHDIISKLIQLKIDGQL